MILLNLNLSLCSSWINSLGKLRLFCGHTFVYGTSLLQCGWKHFVCCFWQIQGNDRTESGKQGKQILRKYFVVFYLLDVILVGCNRQEK